MFFESRGNISIFTENRKFLAITRKLPRFFDLFDFFNAISISYNDNIEKKNTHMKISNNINAYLSSTPCKNWHSYLRNLFY